MPVDDPNNGRNDSPNRGGTYEPGAWRIELCPKAPAETDHFLNVMHVMDGVKGAEPLVPTIVESDQMLGVKIADRVVLFSKSGERLQEGITFTISDSQAELKYMVTDLKAGQWQVKGPSSLSQKAKEGGVLYFQGTAGTYVLEFVG